MFVAPFAADDSRPTLTGTQSLILTTDESKTYTCTSVQFKRAPLFPPDFLRVRFKVMRRFANRCSLGKCWQRHSATGRYWQFFRRALKFAFASITITVENSEGNLKEAAVIETSHVTKNPQRECITLDRTRFLLISSPVWIKLVMSETMPYREGAELQGPADAARKPTLHCPAPAP
jgi:hypothetical protein